MTVITSSQYHAMVFSLLLTLVMSGACLLLALAPRPRELPWRRWARRVPGRHLAVLAVLREDYQGCWRGLPCREIERASGSRCARTVLRRLAECGWAERTESGRLTPYHMGRHAWRLTPDGWAATGRLPGIRPPGGRHAALPDGHPSGPIAPACTPESPSSSGSPSPGRTGGR